MDTSTVVSVIVGFAACFLAFLQLVLMQRQREIMDDQSALMKRQLDIANEQAEIVNRQLAKQPQLEMSVRIVKVGQDPRDESFIVELGVFVENNGTRAADGFTWQFGIDLINNYVDLHVAEVGIQVQPDSISLNGKSFQLFKHRVESDLYKGRAVKVAGCFVRHLTLPLPITFIFQITWNDGEYPGGGYRAVTTVLKNDSDGRSIAGSDGALPICAV